MIRHRAEIRHRADEDTPSVKWTTNPIRHSMLRPGTTGIAIEYAIL
jgi:hypothetical protein